jgi:hypothetical protein
MNMKKVIFLILLAFQFGNVMAYDKEFECRARVDPSRSRAQWGIDMRKQMLQECGNKNLQSCGQKYVQKITAQKAKDDADARRMFNERNLDEFTRIMILTNNVSMETAAYIGLKYDNKTADQIADEMYSKCLSMGR